VFPSLVDCFRRVDLNRGLAEKTLPLGGSLPAWRAKVLTPLRRQPVVSSNQ